MMDVHRTPWGIQLDGPGADAKPITLTVEDQDYLGDIKILQDNFDKVRAIVMPACSKDILMAAISSMLSVNNVLKEMPAPLSSELPFYRFNGL